MVNRAILVGLLGKDPESVKTQKGQIVKLNLATKEWRKSGEVVEWHRVSVFNDKICETMMNYAKKGDQLYVEGKIQTKTVETDRGTKYFVDIVVGPYDGQIRLLGGSRAAKNGDGHARQPASHESRQRPPIERGRPSPNSVESNFQDEDVEY